MSDQSPEQLTPPKRRKWWRILAILALLVVAWLGGRESEKLEEKEPVKSTQPATTTQKSEERTAANTTPSEEPMNEAEKSTQKSEERTAAGSDKQPVAKNYKITIKMAAANIQHNFDGEGDVIKSPITGEVFVSTEEDSVGMKPVGKDAFGNQVFEGMWINKKTNEGFHLGRMTKEDVSRGACWRNKEANVCAFPR